MNEPEHPQRDAPAGWIRLRAQDRHTLLLWASSVSGAFEVRVGVETSDDFQRVTVLSSECALNSPGVSSVPVPIEQDTWGRPCFRVSGDAGARWHVFLHRGPS